MSGEPLSREEANRLHQRNLLRDPTASAEISEAFLPYVTGRLREAYPTLFDPHLVDTAAVDGLLDYLSRPEKYDPQLATLGKYLYMIARRDLLNLLSKHKRWSAPGGKESVELDAGEREYPLDGELTVEERAFIRASPLWAQLDHLITDPRERQALQLMLDGERDTASFADALGLAGQTAEEQAAAVKRCKDRLKKTLQRHLRMETL